MEDKQPIFEIKGYLTALIAFVITFALFYAWTAEPFYCLIVAAINACIIWGTYLVIRMCYLASR